MYELRGLQHGHRPVTGQDNKRAVESFFNRALQESSGEGPAPGYEPPRPEAVVVEVNALVERRPVSSVLQSQRFRNNLEHVLRGTIGQLSARLPRGSETSQQGPQQETSQAASSPSRSRRQDSEGLAREDTTPETATSAVGK